MYLDHTQLAGACRQMQGRLPLQVLLVDEVFLVVVAVVTVLLHLVVVVSELVLGGPQWHVLAQLAGHQCVTGAVPAQCGGVKSSALFFIFDSPRRSVRQQNPYHVGVASGCGEVKRCLTSTVPLVDLGCLSVVELTHGRYQSSGVLSVRAHRRQVKTSVLLQIILVDLPHHHHQHHQHHGCTRCYGQ